MSSEYPFFRVNGAYHGQLMEESQGCPESLRHKGPRILSAIAATGCMKDQRSMDQQELLVPGISIPPIVSLTHEPDGVAKVTVEDGKGGSNQYQLLTNEKVASLLV